MFLVSCETGGRRVPAQWTLTRPKSSPGRGIASDSGGRYAARRLAENLSVPLIENEFALECVDVTKSSRHPRLFTGSAKNLSDVERAQLMNQIYWPYRERIRRAIVGGMGASPFVIHLCVRTFAASNKGRMRRADVGLLYDPARNDEVDFCLDWMDELFEIAPMLRVRRNYPRRGTSDSLTRAMRVEFAGQPYLGIELGLNRAWASRPLKIRDEALDGLADSLQEIFSVPRREAA